MIRWLKRLFLRKPKRAQPICPACGKGFSDHHLHNPTRGVRIGGKNYRYACTACRTKEAPG